MFARTKVNSSSESLRAMILIALLAATFLAMPVLAKDEGPTVSVERLKGLGVGLKIIFPDAINEDLNVIFNGATMNCELVTSDTMNCIGSLQPKEIGDLNIYDDTGNTAILATTVMGPASNYQGGE